MIGKSLQGGCTCRKLRVFWYWSPMHFTARIVELSCYSNLLICKSPTWPKWFEQVCMLLVFWFEYNLNRWSPIDVISKFTIQYTNHYKVVWVCFQYFDLNSKSLVCYEYMYLKHYITRIALKVTVQLISRYTCKRRDVSSSNCTL